MSSSSSTTSITNAPTSTASSNSQQQAQQQQQPPSTADSVLDSITFSGKLQDAINSVSPNTNNDPVDCVDFNPLNYLNSAFPDGKKVDNMKVLNNPQQWNL